MTKEIYRQRVRLIFKTMNKLLLRHGEFTKAWQYLPDSVDGVGVIDGFWQSGYDTYAALFRPYAGPAGPMEDLLVVLWIRQEDRVYENGEIDFCMDTYDRGEYLLEKNSRGLLEREEKMLYGPAEGDECVVQCALTADGRFQPECDRLQLAEAVETMIEDNLMMRAEERYNYWDEHCSWGVGV